mmetsp:Transcript_25785/g.76359  ORF Transcript_25785/g.76359 Transcript_25785/m.76359 type:complete len:258 (+) Transcript_25785:285-1058(+)
MTLASVVRCASTGMPCPTCRSTAHSSECSSRRSAAHHSSHIEQTISSVSGSSPTSPAMLCNPSSPPLSAPAALAAATSIRSALGCMSPAAMCATRRETLLPLRARRRDAGMPRIPGEHSSDAVSTERRWDDARRSHRDVPSADSATGGPPPSEHQPGDPGADDDASDGERLGVLCHRISERAPGRRSISGDASQLAPAVAAAASAAAAPPLTADGASSRLPNPVRLLVVPGRWLRCCSSPSVERYITPPRPDARCPL